MNEKIYKTMASSGAGSLALGIVVLVTGLVTGILMIVNGARLLKRKGMFALFTNIFGNVLGFMPYGFVLPVINRRMRNGFFIILSGFSISLTVEVIQLITRVGCFDVDDMILNTLGAALGYGIYAVCDKIRRKH